MREIEDFLGEGIVRIEIEKGQIPKADSLVLKFKNESNKINK